MVELCVVDVATRGVEEDYPDHVIPSNHSRVISCPLNNIWPNAISIARTRLSK